MPPSAPNICQNGHNYKHFSAADISCQTTVDLKSNVVAHSGQIGMAVCTTKANLMPSGGFRGGPSQLPPPFGRWTDTVTVLLVMLASAKFWSFYCKTCIQNTQNDCYQWLSRSFRVHQIRFWPGLCPEPHWGTLQRSLRPPSWLKVWPYF